MRVKFRVNLGSVDAWSMRLDFAKCTAGAECEVDEQCAQRLIANGIAEPAPPTIKAVPKEPEIAGEEKKPKGGK